jgi:hypothetical protein
MTNYTEPNKAMALAEHLGVDYFVHGQTIYQGDQEDFEDQFTRCYNDYDNDFSSFLTDVAEELGDEITEASYDENYFSYGNREYLVVDDAEADRLWDVSLDNYIDECILPEVPEFVRYYFDEKSWKSDARIDGRGHSLSHYDGCEHDVSIDDDTYYIYRTN